MQTRPCPETGRCRNCGLVGEVDIALGSPDQRMIEHHGNGDQVHAVHRGNRRLGVAKVVRSRARQSGLVADDVYVHDKGKTGQ